MNQLLFERSVGSLGPQAFARLHVSHLLTSIGHEPRIRFDGANISKVSDQTEGVAGEAQSIWSHSSGVNAVVVDPFEGKW